MLRSLLTILLIAILAAVAEIFLPWWSLALVVFALCILLKTAPGKAFGIGFTGIFLLWLGWSLQWDIPNHHILSQRMANLFGVHQYVLFLLITALVGGLVGGLAGWSGAQARKAFIAS